MNTDYTVEEIAAFKARLATDPYTGCHNWTGCTQKPGKNHQLPYAIARLRGKQMHGHRIAMMFEIGGPIPDDKWVLHRCDNATCCNPRHLYLGSPQDNVDDMMARGRRAPSPPRGSAISDDVARMLAASGLTLTGIKETYHHDTRTVRAAFTRLGLPIPVAPTYSISDERIREIASWGLRSFAQMSARSGHGKATLARAFARLGLARPNKHGKPRKLTDDRLREIAAAGLPSFMEMHRQFGHCATDMRAGFYRLGLDLPAGKPGRKPNPKA